MYVAHLGIDGPPNLINNVPAIGMDDAEVTRPTSLNTPDIWYETVTVVSQWNSPSHIVTMFMAIVIVSINSACRLPYIVMDHLCILVIVLPLSIGAKIYCNDSKITEFEMVDTKKLLYWLCSKV